MFRRFVCSMFLIWWKCNTCPCVRRVLFILHLGLILLHQIPGGLKNLLLTTHLRIFDPIFESPGIQFGACPTLFLSLPFSGLTKDPKLGEKNLLLALSAHHQINSSCFCHRWAIVRSRVLSSLRHGTNRKALSDLRERKLLKWPQEHMEKLIILNIHSGCFHSSPEKLPLVRMSANCLLVSTYLVWIWGSKLTLSNNKSIATLWEFGHMSHRQTSSLNHHLDHSFVFKDVQLRFTLRRMCVGGYLILDQPSIFFWHVGS